MTIQNSQKEDIEEILRLYGLATALQKQKGATPWPEFERNQILTEIENKMQWKIVDNNTITGVFVTMLNDPIIWGSQNSDPAVYIHRIASNPDCRVKPIVPVIIKWVKSYAALNDKRYIRLDTAGVNNDLISYYTSCGFTYLGIKFLSNYEQLPVHYHNNPINLFEIDLNS